MKKSLFASAAVLTLVLASPALAQRDERDNADQNAPRSGHVSRDNNTNNNPPRGENRERPAPTVSPSGTMGGENRGRPEASGTMGMERGTRHERGTANTVQPSGTMGMERGTRHERGTTNTVQPSGTMGMERGTRHERGTMRPGGTTTVRPNAGTGMMAPRTGRTIGGGAHVHNPAFNSMRRVFNAPQRFHVGTYVRPSGWYSHRWRFGEFLPGFFFARNYWILDWGDYDLDDPPPGTIWVRVGDDALLIDEYTGEVIQVAYGIFY